jgi:uncharacterized membrane protein
MSESSGNTSIPQIIYILLVANIVIPFTSLIGVIMAYVNKDDASEWLKSHYRFQIRTFWIGILYFIIGFITVPIFIGFAIWGFTVIWLAVRCVKGLKFLDAKQAHPNPTTWMFS